MRVAANGKLLDLEVLTTNGYNLVPLRPLAELFGARVSWIAASRTVVIKKSGTLSLLPVGSTTARIGTRQVQVEEPATIYQDVRLSPHPARRVTLRQPIEPLVSVVYRTSYSGS